MTMAKRTKKVGSAGRLGPRYGVRIRKRIADIEKLSKKWHECPKCMAKAVKREANGIWKCRHCGVSIASSSYVLTKPVAVKREVTDVLAEARALAKAAAAADEENEVLSEEERLEEVSEKE